MNQAQQNRGSLPPLIVSKDNYKRIIDLAIFAEDSAPEVASVLIAEMERARIVSTKALPSTAVQMGSTVAYRTDSGEERRVTLVYPGEADISQGKISILTPIGAALIGLSSGQSIPWTARDLRQQRLTVLKVDPPAIAATDLASEQA
jgi:regulator of nucleoside diphosphate kinase